MSSRRVWAETFPSLPRSRSSCRTCPSAGEAVQANAAASIRKRIRGMLGPWPTRLAVRPVGMRGRVEGGSRAGRGEARRPERRNPRPTLTPIEGS